MNFSYLPHARQWCFLRMKKIKFILQRLHSFELSLGIQLIGLIWWLSLEFCGAKAKYCYDAIKLQEVERFEQYPLLKPFDCCWMILWDDERCYFSSELNIYSIDTFDSLFRDLWLKLVRLLLIGAISLLLNSKLFLLTSPPPTVILLW